ncbi:MAG TPA: nuclear transport factor 2 family protein [Candidatus Solibacter sp.]|nr:nuclear transport factor 2 family protein [Candidatus Solibacter sp.]
MDKFEDTVLALERAALDRWGKGDPGGYLEISAPDVTYFDPFVKQRVDGIDALKAWYEPVRGKIRIDRDEIVNPRVQVIGDAAILTMQFVSHGSEGAKRWNCTEVYGRADGEWKIVHTHWSFAAEL